MNGKSLTRPTSQTGRRNEREVTGAAGVACGMSNVRTSISSTPLKLNCVSMSVSSARREPGWLFFSTRAYLVSNDVNWKPLQREQEN